MELLVIAVVVGGAVIFLVLASSTGLRAQGSGGARGGGAGNQRSAPGQDDWWAQQRDYGVGQQRDSGSRQSGQSGGAGKRGGNLGGVMQFLVILGVLVIAGACGILFLALQGGIQ
jgi:hypothetical protein